jgi:hypothetical protein
LNWLKTFFKSFAILASSLISPATTAKPFPASLALSDIWFMLWRSWKSFPRRAALRLAAGTLRLLR